MSRRRLFEYRGLWTVLNSRKFWWVLEGVWVPEWRSWAYVLVDRRGVIPYRQIPPGDSLRLIPSKEIEMIPVGWSP